MLFLSLFSGTDTWVQLMVESVTCCFKTRAKQLIGPLESNSPKTDLGPLPQFDLPISHIVVEPDSIGYQVTQEQKQANLVDLQDIIVNGDMVQLEKTVVDEAES